MGVAACRPPVSGLRSAQGRVLGHLRCRELTGHAAVLHCAGCSRDAHRLAGSWLSASAPAAEDRAPATGARPPSCLHTRTLERDARPGAACSALPARESTPGHARALLPLAVPASCSLARVLRLSLGSVQQRLHMGASQETLARRRRAGAARPPSLSDCCEVYLKLSAGLSQHDPLPSTARTTQYPAHHCAARAGSPHRCPDTLDTVCPATVVDCRQPRSALPAPSGPRPGRPRAARAREAQRDLSAR